MPKFIRTAGRSGATEPIARIAAGGLARVALAACALALAALVVTSTGASGLGGALGSLFGVHSAAAERSKASAQPIAAPSVDAPVTRASRTHSSPASAPVRHPRTPARGPTPAHPRVGRPQLRAPQSSPHTIPTQTQPPPAPPAQPPPGVVGGVGAAVRGAGTALPPPAQPVVDQAVEAIGQVCGLFDGCP
jgi:hypothetical protein